jgi:hypothetical protein
MSKLSQIRRGSSAQRVQARRKSLASRLLLPAIFTIAVAAIAALVPFGHGERSISYAEAAFASGNTVDMLFTPSGGEPPHLGNAPSLGHNSPLNLQRLARNATVRALVGTLGQAVSALARAPLTSTTARLAAVRRDDGGRPRSAVTPTASGVPITGILPSPTPPPAPHQAQLAWPPGTTAETYKFTSPDKTAADVQSLINGKTYADRALDVLDQLSIRDIVDALKLLERNYATVDALRRLPQAANFPRVAGAAAAVKDPEGFVLPAEIEDKQRSELEAFRKVRRWPALLPTKAVALDSTQETIVDFIRRERSTIPEHPLDVIPQDDNNMGGYKYSGKPGLDPKPTNLQDKDPRRTAINEAVWKELAGEGSGASINTYDTQRAIVTWGRGFSAKGQLPEAMSKLFVTDPAVRTLLLDAGFTLTGDEWLAVDVSTGQVKTGDDALNLVRGDKKILSRLINIAEDPAHAQKWIDAQAATILAHAGAVPDAAKGWPDGVIRFVAHCVHWGGLTWPSAIAAGGDLKTIVELQSLHVSAAKPWRGGSQLVSTQSTRTFLNMADGIARDVLGTAEAAPTVDDQDNTTMNGHIFFDAGGDQFFHLSP